MILTLNKMENSRHMSAIFILWSKTASILILKNG